jgi:DNA-binding transcriptional LysR family regulator
MDPKRVLTFRAVAHQRSFSRAADELALSQPSVSQQVAALERELGTRLLDRRSGGLQLTPAGEVLLEHADSIAERFDLAAVQLAELAEGERARLRIGAFPTALAEFVPGAVAQLRERFPGARVTVDEGSAEDLPARVQSGELHFAVTFQDAAQRRREHEGLERRDLMREAFLVALPPHHRLAARRAVRLSDLADDSWTVALTDGLIVRACRAAGFDPHVISITRDQLAIRALILRDLAVTLAPALLADAFRDVALRPIAGGGPQRDVYAVLPPGGRHPLAEHALNALAATADALSAVNRADQTLSQLEHRLPASPSRTRRHVD